MSWIKNFLLVILSILVTITIFLAFDYFYTLKIYGHRDLQNEVNGINENLDNGWYALRKNVDGFTRWTHDTIYRVSSSNEGFRINPKNFG